MRERYVREKYVREVCAREVCEREVSVRGVRERGACERGACDECSSLSPAPCCPVVIHPDTASRSVWDWCTFCLTTTARSSSFPLHGAHRDHPQ
jgi:hypothetical protein